MRIAVPVLLGLTAVIMGAYIRSCTAPSAAMHSAWCGTPPDGALALAAQGHCAGCALIAAGLLAIVGGMAAAMFRLRRPAPRKVRA